MHVNARPIKIFEEPDNTQDEFDLFQSERRQIELLRNSELATVQVEDEFYQAMLEPCPPVSQKPFLLSNLSSSEQAVETARASYEALVHNKPVMHANAQTRCPILNPYAKKTKVVNPYIKKKGHALQQVNGNDVNNPYRVPV